MAGWSKAIRIGAVLLAASAAALAPEGAARAQGNPFAPAILVGDQVVTNYELAQREAILRLFRTPGNIAEQAREALIDERLQIAAAERLGIRASEEAVQAGMEEFAARADLSVEAFLAALDQEGIAEATFRDFVRAGVTWREVVRTRFGPRAQVTEAEIDRALALTSRRGGAEVDISEIVIPVSNRAEQARAEEIAAGLAGRVTSAGEFAAAARQYSASPSRARGGRVAEPVPLANLPPPLRAQIVTLAPGEVSDPVPLPNAVAVFRLRALRETGLPEPENVVVDYAQYFIPGGRGEAALAEAARVAAQVDTCDDLYGVNLGQPEERLVVETLPVDAVPQDIALHLARLDEGEHSTALTRGDALVFLMLCGRTAIREEEVDRGAVRSRLIDQRLGAYADGYLAELRADAIIRTP